MKRAAALALVVAALASSATAAGSSPLTVFAAASLTNVFPKIDPAEQYSFGGSNMLAAQIEQGAPADVFASANMKLPSELHQAGLCSTPVVFTRNRLTVILPRKNPAHLKSIYQLTRKHVKIVIAAKGVPVGDYTLQVLTKLHMRKAVLRNVVSEETDVREVLAKVALGEADAGFVYRTDARVDAGKVRVLRIPARAQPNVRYGICTVSRTKNRTAAVAFVRRVLSPAGQKQLRLAGFLRRTPKHR
jgi:molybdate transport system substrate-binding protein